MLTCTVAFGVLVDGCRCFLGKNRLRGQVAGVSVE